MGTITKLGGIAAATVMVLAAGPAALMPAHAAPQPMPKLSGSTTFTLSTETVTNMAGWGIVTTVTPPASMTTAPPVTLTFPVNGYSDSGITHGGSVSFSSKDNPQGLEGTSPVLSFTGDDTLSVTLTVAGLPVSLFDITEVTKSTSETTIRRAGKVWKAKRVVSLSGTLRFTTNKTVMDAMNGYLGTPTAFVPGLAIGTMSSAMTETKVCKTRADCGFASG